MKIDEILSLYEKSKAQIENGTFDFKNAESVKNWASLTSAQEEIENLLETRKKIHSLDELQNEISDSEEEMLSEIVSEKEKLTKLANHLKEEILLQISKQNDPAQNSNENRSLVMEIRCAAGGDESSLFVGDLYRMYSRFAEKKKWKFDPMSISSNEVGGYKEVILSVIGKNAYEFLQFESGTHRVQRVPETESSGRIHTSTATVTVLIEPSPIEINIQPKDIRIDVQRSSGPGGQSVNTTDSSVRITHLPTGLVVLQQDEKSQHKNKAKAMRILMARLYELEKNKRDAAILQERSKQVGGGDRSDKIRTYNFAQNRVTDHRANISSHDLVKILDGEIEKFLIEILEKIKTQPQQDSNFESLE